MATFEVNIGGKTIEVEAPDAETLRMHLPTITAGAGIKPLDMATGTSAVSPGEDPTRLFTSALGKGTVGLAGLPGEAERLAQLGFDWGERMIGTRDKPQTEDELRAKRLFADSGEMVNRYETMTGTPFYQPKTSTGRFVDTALSFVPGALVGGGSGSVLKNMFRSGIVPGVASEAAGQIAQKYVPSLEEVVRITAGLGAGGRGMIKDRPVPRGMSADALRTSGSRFFEEARSRNVILTPDSFGKFVDDIGSQLYRDKINKGVDTNAFRVLTDLENMKGAAVDLEELKRVRSIASAGSVDFNKPYDAKLSGDIRTAIDDYVHGLTGRDTLAGDIAGVPEMLDNGRRLWAQMHKSEDVSEAIRLAKISDAWTKGNEDQALRNAFRPLAASKDFTRRFTPEEQKAILDVIGANGAEKLARILGGGSYDRGLRQGLAGMGAGGVAGGLLSGGSPVGAAVGAGVAPFVAAGAERVANKMTKRQAELVQALIGGYKPESSLASGIRSARSAVLGAYLLNMTANRPGHKSEAR